MFNFSDLEARYGAAFAYQCLIEIERAARVNPTMVDEIDPEVRLSKAIDIIDQISAA